jgi:acetyl esterase/lipase
MNNLKFVRGLLKHTGFNTVLALTLLANRVQAHPGSGIVVDQRGQVFISDLTRGLLKIDAQGRATSPHKEGGHWLALDLAGGFAQVDFEQSKHWPRWFKRRTATGVQPALIADGGSPLVIGRDGNLYYVCNDEQMIPGGLQIARLTPDGKETLLNPGLREISEKLGGIKGLTSGPDGSLYASYPKAVLKITLEGKVTTVANPVVVKDCDANVGANEIPFLSGLAVDSRGVVYVAASGCGCVIKIMSDGNVTTVLKAERPWAPSGVALHEHELYVLEHINPNSPTHEDWAPRVRKVGRDGKATTLWTSSNIAAGDAPLVVEIWPGQVPDESGGIGPERVRMSPKLDHKQVEVTNQTRLITAVTKPTLTIHRPAREIDTGAAMLICPGGGYWDLYWQLEGEEVAAWLNSIGVTGIILKYRVPRRPDEPEGEPARRPLQDAQRAMSLVRSKASEWGINPARIGVVGFSAGGHLAVATATSFEKRTYPPIDDVDKITCRPDFAVAVYSGYLKNKDRDELASSLHIPASTPPVFLVHGSADIISPPEHSVLLYLALRRAAVPVELHVYAGTAHDFGVRTNSRPYSAWTRSCAEWLRDQGFVSKASSPGL